MSTDNNTLTASGQAGHNVPTLFLIFTPLAVGAVIAFCRWEEPADRVFSISHALEGFHQRRSGAVKWLTWPFYALEISTRNISDKRFRAGTIATLWFYIAAIVIFMLYIAAIVVIGGIILGAIGLVISTLLGERLPSFSGFGGRREPAPKPMPPQIRAIEEPHFEERSSEERPPARFKVDVQLVDDKNNPVRGEYVWIVFDGLLSGNIHEFTNRDGHAVFEYDIPGGDATICVGVEMKERGRYHIRDGDAYTVIYELPY